MPLIQRDLNEKEEKNNSRAVLAHVIPFVIWLTMMVWFDDPSWNYNARTLGGIILLFFYKPWKWYSKFNICNLPYALIAGIFIFFIWIGFESPLVISNFPIITEWYDKIFVDLSEPFKTRELYDRGDGVFVPFMVIEEGVHRGLHVYDPKVTGWMSFTIHMIGTSVIIAVIEEFFYRGFAYRWMQGSPFFEIDAGRLHWRLLAIISIFFAVSHIECGAAFIFGLVYGFLYIKTKDIWAAIIAHGTTNFLLGWYVIIFDAYQYW